MELSYGSASEWDALVYGQSNPSTVNFLQNQFNTVTNMLTDAGRQFMDRGKAAFDYFNGANAIRFAREAVKSVKGMFEVYQIGQLKTIDEMRNSNDIMQRWVMANPNIRQRYFDQKLDGYSDTFTNVHSFDIGESHYDYRRVMDGIAVFDDEGNWKITEYVEPLLEGDRDLLFGEQLDIQRTWSAMDVLVALGNDDPTSPDGGKL